MDKNSLMASLMGDGPEQDLFGDVPIADDQDGNAVVDGGVNGDPLGTSVPPPFGGPASTSMSTGAGAGAGTAGIDTGDPMAASAPVIGSDPASSAPAPAGPSLLAQSGLLGMAEESVGNCGGSNSGGGGLFDAVDEEEARKEQERRAAEAEAEAERQRQQAEAAARLQKQREEEEARQRQLQMQQQQMQMQMQMQQPPGPYGYASQPQPQPLGTPSPYPPQSLSQSQYPQQQSTMMQSANLNYNSTPQQQVQAGMQNMSLQPPNQGFYREHPPSVINTGPPPYSNTYSGAPPGNQYYYGTQEPQMRHTPPPNITAGMHNATPPAMGYNGAGAARMMPPPQQVRKITLVKPQEVPPLYTQIHVSEPMLIQQQNFLISSAPYWSYQISTQLAPPQQGTWLVRRRFRHVVALEERLRQACPGSILPPRPDKHATRALEEASAQQSAEFAMQRARELNQYLNALVKHPVAGQSQVLRLFLGLQDDIGTAWPEVSGNAFTKLGAVAAGMSMKVAETTQLTAANAPAHEWEEDAELLALSSSENLRMGAVSQAVPKLEGAVTVLREQGDAAGAVGMELSKISKLPSNEDFKVCDVLSNGLLRHGRRNKRLALELSAAMDSFLQQYKMVRYEKMALQDRRQAIQRKGTYRRGADQRAMYLAQQQRQLQSTGQFGQLNQLERNAIQTDSMANEIVGEAEEIAARLKSEIHRVAIDRRTQWNASMHTVAKAMKEACTERLAIWESTLEALKALPGGMPCEDGGSVNGAAPSGMMISGTPPSQVGGGMAHQGEMNGSVPVLQNTNQQLDTSTIYA